VDQNIAPVLIGEFGGKSVGEDLEGQWQRALFAYIKEKGLSYTYWSLNPNSGDTGGVLLDDWKTVDRAKLQLLAQDQSPLLKPEVATAEGDAAPGAMPGPTDTPRPTQVGATPTGTTSPQATPAQSRQAETSMWAGASDLLARLVDMIFGRFR
jgi:endoglucanase